MKAWHDLIKRVWEGGTKREDRTGIGTRAKFGESIELLNIEHSFPAVTTKKLAFKQCMGEMAAFIHGSDNLEQFHAYGCKVWDGNSRAAYWQPRKEGDLGRIYGVQWRNWRSEEMVVDQLMKLVGDLREDPYSRRHVVTAWNPGELHQMCLPPCHIFFQCFVDKGCLDLQVYMRSVDVLLGLPFDIAGYALLQRLLASEADLASRRLLFTFGDTHIYLNHEKAMQEVLAREPYEAPILALAPRATLFTFKPEYATLENYKHHPAIKVELNV